MHDIRAALGNSNSAGEKVPGRLYSHSEFIGTYLRQRGYLAC